MTTNKQQQDEFKAVKQRLSALQLVKKKDLKDGRLPRVDDVDLGVLLPTAGTLIGLQATSKS